MLSTKLSEQVRILDLEDLETKQNHFKNLQRKIAKFKTSEELVNIELRNKLEICTNQKVEEDSLDEPKEICGNNTSLKFGVWREEHLIFCGVFELVSEIEHIQILRSARRIPGWPSCKNIESF